MYINMCININLIVIAYTNQVKMVPVFSLDFDADSGEQANCLFSDCDGKKAQE